MATPLNGRPHTTLGVTVEQDVSAATTNDVRPTLLSVNGASLQHSNSSSVSDDEVGFLHFALPVLHLRYNTR